MQTEPYALHVGRARLRLCPGRVDTASNAPPEINLVVQIDRQAEVAGPIVGETRRREIGLVGGLAYRAGACSHTERRDFARAREPNGRACRAEGLLRDLQRLVRVIDLGLEGIELGVLVH